MIDWRGLLNDIQVPWIDHGKNTSAGNVNIACVLCGEDPSYHLSLSENKPAYFCYRDDRHRGTSLEYLVGKLCGSRDEARKLLAQYSDADINYQRPARPAISAVQKQWQFFDPATDSDQCMDYLEDRGFDTSVITEYDLRYALGGPWAQRLLLPVMENEELITWLGRSLRPSLHPKYQAQQIEHPGYIYIPRSGRNIMVVVEGPLDALKIAHAADRDILPVAMLGKMMTAGKLRRLGLASRGVNRVYVALDADTTVMEGYRFIQELAPLCRCAVRRLPLPRGFKDPGEMGYDDIVAWMNDIKS